MTAEDEVIQAFGERYLDALMCFDAADLPLWQRTHNGLQCFVGLRLDNLRPQLCRRVEKAFIRINAITTRYPVKTAADYQLLPTADLLRLQSIIKAI